MLKYSIYCTIFAFLTVGIQGTNLSNTPGVSCSSYVSQHSVATDSKNRTHVVWYDEGDTTKTKTLYERSLLFRAPAGVKQAGGSNIYYRRAINLGTTWDTTVDLTKFDSANALWPSIATNDEDIVHIVWNDDHTHTEQVYYIGSIDGGQNWNPIMKLSNTTNPSEAATVTTSGDSSVFVVWREDKDSIHNIWYRRSTDGGNTWDSANVLAEASTFPLMEGVTIHPLPSMAASDNFVHLVWQDSAYGDTLSFVFYKRSNDYGVNWSTDAMITSDNNLHSLWPTVAAHNAMVYVVWAEQASVGDSLFHVHFRRSTDNGDTWEPAVRVVQDTLDVMFGTPQVTAKDKIVAIVWSDYLDRIYFKASDDFGTNWTADNFVGIGIQPSIAIDSEDNINVVWTDTELEVFYQRFAFAGIEKEIEIISKHIDLTIAPTLATQYVSIKFNIPYARSTKISLKIYNVGGQLIRTLVDNSIEQGMHTRSWNCRDNQGNLVNSGVYFCKLQVEELSSVNKIVIMR